MPMADETEEKSGLGKILLIGFLVFLAILAAVVVGVMVFGDSGELDLFYEGFD